MEGENKMVKEKQEVVHRGGPQSKKAIKSDCNHF